MQFEEKDEKEIMAAATLVALMKITVLKKCNEKFAM